jgi:hypothetical protein
MIHERVKHDTCNATLAKKDHVSWVFPAHPFLPPLPSIDEVYSGEELLCGEITAYNSL